MVAMRAAASTKAMARGLAKAAELASGDRKPLWWELALFWLCWLALVLLTAWLSVRLFTA
jgi:hypothetical protein